MKGICVLRVSIQEVGAIKRTRNIIIVYKYILSVVFDNLNVIFIVNSYLLTPGWLITYQLNRKSVKVFICCVRFHSGSSILLTKRHFF